jgi:hypothetical protein
MKTSYKLLVLTMVVVGQFLPSGLIKVSAQEAARVLVAEKSKTHKQVIFSVGETASYRTAKSSGFNKARISEITDSTISFTNKKTGSVPIPFKDITALKKMKQGSEAGGVALIVVGVAGAVLGAFLIGIAASNTGSGHTGPEVLVPIGGAIFVGLGIAVLQPDVANLSTLKTMSQKEIAVTAREGAKPDTVQYYKKFKVGGFAGYGTQFNNTSGLVLTVEPAVRINDNVAIGLRAERAAITSSEFYVSGNPGGTVPGSNGTTSLTVNTQFYLAKGEFRPFFGFGIGPYFFSNPTVTKVGVYPRLGFDAGQFTFTMDYNVIPKLSGYLDLNPCSDPTNLGNCGSAYFYDLNYSYMAFRLGYTLGGGRK